MLQERAHDLLAEGRGIGRAHGLVGGLLRHGGAGFLPSMSMAR